MNDNYFVEINMIMEYFALVDQCQNLASQGYSLDFTMRSMPLIEEAMKGEFQNNRSIELFEKLEEIYFPRRTKDGKRSS